MIRAISKGLSTIRFRFATTTKQTGKEEDEDITLAFFYRRLLRNTRVKPNGNSKFNAFDLHYMARLAEEPHEADLLLEAYYNLLGHNTRIGQRTIDIVVQRCIEINPTPSKVLDLYERHHLIGYFPHYNTTEKLVERIAGDAQSLHRFVGITLKNPFIKLNSKIISITLDALKGQGAFKQMRTFFLHSVKKSPEALQSQDVSRYLQTISKLPEEYITNSIEKLQGSKDDQDIHRLARIYLRAGRPFEQVFNQLSKLKSLELDEIENTFQGILKISQSIYAKKPEVYEQAVKLYNSTLKKMNKSQSLLELEQKILNVPQESQRQQENEGSENSDQPPK